MAERVDGPGTTRGNRKDDELSQANDFRLSDEEVDRHDVVMHQPGHMEKPLDPESSAVFTNDDEAVAAASTETADSSQTGLPPLEDTASVTEEFAPARTSEVGTSSRPTQEEKLAPEAFNTVTAPIGDEPSPAEQPSRFAGERSERGEDTPPPAAPAPQAATSSESDPVPVDTTDPTPTPTNLAATVSLQNIVAGLSETTDTSSSVKVADIVITDDGIGTNTLSLAGADAAKFEIVDTGSGFELHLRAGTVLDHETDAAFDITVQVDDPTVGGTPDDTVSQTVNIGDVNDTGQVFLSGNASNAAENINDAAVVYTASVTDADTTGEAITFSLVDDAGGLFEIDANTGQVTLAGGQSLDFETATSHDITIRSSDGTNTTDHTVTINVTDVNDNAQVFTSGAATSVAEDVNDSSVIYTATTTDVDTTGETITYSLTDDAGGLFEINSATGEVTLAGGQALDFETATSHDITIRSSDGTNTTDQTVTVNVTNVNEGGVSAITDTDASADGVAENGAIGSVVGITALATDPDSGDTVTYSLSNDAGGLFAIDANTGVVTIVGSWNAEVSQNHTIEVTASSSDGSSAVQTFNVTIEDVDEFNITATTDTDGAANTVAESAAVGTAVGVTAFATDADVTDTVTYSLSSNPGGFFAIDANTGVVTVANALDHETNTSHTIEVTSTSTDGSTSIQTFTINVSDVDEADVGAISDTDGTGNAVNENAAVGTVVGVTAFASDADGTDNVTYSLSDDAGGLFAIDPNTGVVTVAGAIDRETAASYDIEVTATSDDGSTSTQTFTIGVNDLDEFDVSTPTDTNAGANTVSETAANGTAVGITASASDGDATNSAVTYSIVDGSGDPVVGGPFTVDPNTGVVTIADNTQLDYETATSHTIHVKATSADGSEATQSFTVNLTDTDEADVGAISDTNGAGNAVNENASVGTVVGVTAFASDADGTDTVSYSLSDDAGGLFAIDPNTGVVTVAGAIDRETAASYDIEVTATSTDGSTSTQTFTINVNDLDEFDVSTPTDSDATANSVAENAANGTAVGITASAADGDATNSTVTYSLVDGSGDPIVGGPFAVDPNTGVVTVADNSQLDYETATSHTVHIKATSADGSDATQTFTVNLTDVNEAGVGAISDTNANANNVDENSSIGSVVGVTALASDPDVTDTVTYSLSDDAGGLFAIDANTGVVTVAGALDAETAQNHSIEVTATSTDGTTSTQTFNIGVNDVDEFNISATSDNDGTANSVSEAATVGTAVGITALASDADVTDTVTYSLSSNPGGFFAIDANTGVVTVANALDFETDTSHTIEVTSTSDDGSTSTQTFTVNVTDHDEADVGAISDTNASGNAVNENASVGTVVGVTAFASDTDGTDTVSYSLSDDAGGLFTIDPNTGVVTVAGAIDRETAASYDIEVTATSTDGSTSTQTFTISVNDLDEFDVSTPTDSNAAANSVAENAANGTAVGITATAADGDATNSTVTYSLVDGSGDPVVGGPFAVDPNTGVVSVADNTQLDYETATSHTIYIKATSADGSDATQSFTINLTDADEGGVGAVSDSNVAGNAVNEDASVGTVVGITAVATDPDGSDTVTYSLSDDAGGLFTIDANTGVVTVAAGLDAETAQNHSIEVTATSTDGSTSTQTFNIGVNDVDEFDISATSDNDGTANSVSESATVGTAVGVTALATDADVTDSVTYSLSSNPGGFFAIDANTGVVTVANALDYETDTSHTIEVTSTSDDGTTSTQTFTINVSDEDEADVGAISDTNAAGNAVDENSSVGTVVGVTAFASDADGTDNVTYSLSDDAGGLFAIDANTGVVTVAGAIDRETAASYDIEVTATSDDGSTSTQTFTVNVNDLDEFDVTTPTDSNAAANSVSESAANGTAVGITASATDGDATNSSVTYSLVDGSGDPVVGGPFAVDANTGVVTVADNSQLDYETATSHTIYVKATSADGSDATQSFTVNLTDADEADVGAISDTNVAGNAVNEDASVGTVVGITALAADPDGTDTVTYSLSDDAGGLFTIDANTGVVTVAAGLDAETAQNHSIEVTATSTDGSTSTQTFNIGVNDVDEFDISATSDNDGTANSVSESATVGTAVGVTALATDADVTDTVTYSLSSNPGGFFAIDANTGVVTVAGALDYETDTSHTIEVTSTSDDGSTSTQTFTINVSDEDEADVGAISDTNAAGNAVDENSSVGTVVGVTAFASDADGTDDVTYSLSDDAGGLFAIDANTGVVTVAGAIDRETAASYDIEVTATSDDGSTSTQTFTVNVNDLDEFDVSTPTDSNVAANSVSESAANGTAVGITASATDGDATNSSVTYSLVDGSGDPVVGGPFAVDANTGVVTVADNSQLDYETATAHTIYVKATSADGSDATQSFTVNLTDADEADVGAISDTNVAGNAVNEDASVGTVVGITALATDADGTDTVTYSLSDDAGGLFTIDANTGVVTVAAGLDAETAQNHSIEVTATSTDGSTSTQTFNIGVNDVDEFDISATSDNDGTANSVSESATVGTAVGVTALATDADVTDSVTYSLSSNPGGFFAIDANTGVVTVAGTLDYETDTSHTIEVTSTSDDGSTSTQTFTINVSDEDEADVGAISDTNAAGNAVDENSSVGTVVGVTAFASDADGTDDVTYSLSDDAGGLFAIDANTGVVTVAGAIDRETAASYDIEVTATSDDGSTSTQTFTVNVNDLDEFDVSTPTDSNAAANSVSESAANGTAVGITASASDGDATNSTVTYSLVDGSGDPVVGGPFAVDANTGVVTVADNSQLDYETATSHTIFVKATSADGSDATQSFTVNLTDADEADVGAISDTNATANAVDENSSVGTVVGITAQASDADGTDTVTYSLSDNAGGLFAIDANTGVVTVAGAIDAETAQNHSIEVTATSTDGSTSTQTFNIAVNDVDEFNVSATTDNDGTANSVSEAATVGTAVGVTALASDVDVTDTVSYSLSSNPGGFFAIDANTGVVTVAGALDFETNTSHVIEVTSTSTDGSTSTETFTINVADFDEADVGAISDTNASANAVDENVAVGTTVGITASATDADGSDDVTYSLSNDAGGLFAIDANTGVVTVAGAIDRETAASYDIEVTATSDDGSTSTQTYTINVNDIDEFDVSTPTDSNAAANTVSETAANGTVVGVTASASDGDATNNGVTYALVDGSGDPVVGGPFAVDANTGVVTVADNSQLDYETATSHTVYIKATSADGSDATQSFTIAVSNELDETPTDITFTGGTVNETVTSGGTIDSAYDPSGATVATLSTTDADSGDSFSYAITTDASGKFEIIGNEVRVKSGQTIDYETDTSFDITVEVTDGGGNTYSEVITINVQDYEGSHTSGTLHEGITGTSEEDILTGDAGQNIMVGGDGDDTMYGGDGHDIIEGGAGADTLVGGDGIDTVRYWGNSSGITIDLENQTVTGGEATGDTISGFENVTASAHNDTIVGSSGDNTIYAQQGDDMITGAGGDDTIYGASGTDTAIYTGTWADYTITESGGTYTIVDNRPGSPDGTDTVSHVEFFQFSDGTFAAADILNDTPTDISHTGGTINENSAVGTVVATLSSTDADSGIPSETATYSITNDPSGYFEIVGNEVRVKTGASIDYESATSHNITVQVTDVHGATYSEVITVNVTDLNDTGQVFTSGAAASAAENVSDSSVIYTATTTDADTTGESITYSLADNAGGLFEIDANTGQVSLASGQSLDYETATSHTITIRSSDGTNTTDHAVTVSVTDVNEAPTDIAFTGNEDLAVGAAIGTTVATATGVDQDAGETFTYSLTNDANGAFTIDSATGAIKIAGGGLGLDLTQQTGSDNPFNGIDVGSWSAPVLVDLDGDGDLDIMIGNAGSYGGDSEYYENTGTATNPTYSFHSENPFGLVDIGSDATPSFVDIDGDGDLDVFIGESDGTINYFENTGNSTSPSFTQRTGAANPLNGHDVGSYSAPTFVDIDNDGDMDAVVGGQNGLLDYFINTGTDQAPSFTEVSDTTFGITGGWNDVGSDATPTFVDADGDGDMDMFVGEADGVLNYYENTGTAANASFSNTPSLNPFGIVDIGSQSTPTFADVDGDGDMDLIVGESDGTINYFENTAALIDGSSTSSHDITVQVTDSGGLTTTEDVRLQFGTDNADTISGDADTDIIYGFDGNDTLSGAGGDDVIYGGEGTDDLDGDAGNDTLVGGTGADNLDGGDGNDTLIGDSEDGDTRLVLNQTGNDDVALASGISDFPTSALTFEISFNSSTLPINGAPLVSYAVASQANEFAIVGRASNSASNPNSVDVYIDGSIYEVSNIAPTLFDGNDHSLSVSWDSATGALNVYVDGALVDSGTHKQGTVLETGGTLVFGQEQDSVGGSYNTDQIFNGTIDEIRLFDDVRTAQEIANNAGSELTDPTNEQGLVSNWQFDTASSTSVTDLAGSNDLTLSNGATVGTPTGSYNDTLTGGDGNDTLYGGVGSDTLSGGTGDDTLYAGDGVTEQSPDEVINGYNPVGYWRLGESSGTTVIDETGTNHGTYANGVTLGVAGPNTGITDTAADFDQTDDYIEIAHNSNLALSTGTIQLWFNADEVGSQKNYLINKKGGADELKVYVENGKLSVDLDGDKIEYTGVNADEWYHFSLSWGANGLELYLNGALVASDPTSTANLTGNTGPMVVGAKDGYNEYWDGTIDEIVVLDSQLAPSEVSALYSSGLNGLPAEVNTLNGDAGNDTIVAGSAVDVIDGGADTDIVSYENSDEAVNVNLDTGVGVGGDAAGDTYTSIEGVIASDHDDTVYGTDTGGVTVNLGAGNDTFDNDAGDATQTDTIYGGAGNDTIYTGAGDDTLYGGEGTDTLWAEAGNDTLQGGAGNDTLYGADGSDLFVFWEGHGTDTISGGQGASWTDTIELHDSSGGSNLGTFGVDWTINLTEGSITNQDSDSLTLSDDADGTITLQDGSSINFYDIERVEF